MKYQLVYADPPWNFKTRGTPAPEDDRAPPYSTLLVPDLKMMAPDVADNALLAMWVYDPMLPQAIELAQAWGFDFCTVLFRWLKTTPSGKMGFGMGYHTRGGACEECWLFKRGKGLPVLSHSIRKEFFSPIRDHSRKPDEVRKWLTKLYGDDVLRLEMFARRRTIGWHVHGDQIN